MLAILHRGPRFGVHILNLGACLTSGEVAPVNDWHDIWKRWGSSKGPLLSESSKMPILTFGPAKELLQTFIFYIFQSSVGVIRSVRGFNIKLHLRLSH